MERQTCINCGQSKPLTEEFFNFRSEGFWRKKCKSCMAEHTRNHHRKHPEQAKARVARYQAQKAAADGNHDDLDMEEIRRQLKDRCRYCNAPLNGGGEKDHKTPMSRGGTKYPANMTWACRRCNRDKGNKTLREFLKWRRDRALPTGS